MIHHKVDQNTEEWFALKLGKFSASWFKDLFAAKNTATYQKAIYKIVYERLTNEVPESFSNHWTERGHEFEPLAAEEYERQTFNEVSDGGFFELNEWVGCSPDRLVGSDGLVEIKCPAYNTMINYLLSQKVPSIYMKQIQGQLYVTGRKWCDFLAYHPKLKPLIIRVERDEKMIDELDTKLIQCIDEVKTIINKIK